MDLSYSYIYDIAVVILLLIGIMSGYRKGALRMVLSIAFTLISVGAATFLSSDRNCEMLYDRYIKDNVVKICTDAVNDSIWKAKEEIAEQTKSVVDSIPDAVGEPEGKIHDITSD
ncbi:MAG: CvpA family protein, partial [Oscillospiraceae bacterium]|nr:CvpA family protein [Oscillospiraceae bacterium]